MSTITYSSSRSRQHAAHDESVAVGVLRTLLPWSPLLLATAFWLYSLHTLDGAAGSQWGLLASGSALFPVSIGLVALAFVVAVRLKRLDIAVVSTVGMVLVERATTSLITKVAPYAWTYKHLGVASYIQENGHLARGTDIYNGWPGLFGATAWFSQVTGLSSITIAHWFTPVLHLAIVGLMVVMARAWGATPMQAVTAAFLVESLNWVAQDYYSPQAIGFVLAIGVIAILGLARERARLTGVAILIFGAITVTHQLTPYWLIAVAVLLAATNRLQPRWLPAVFIAFAVGFVLVNWHVAHPFLTFSLHPVSNTDSAISTPGIHGQQVTSHVIRVMSVALWASAAGAAFLMWRRKQDWIAPSIVAFSSFLIALGQNYGGEAVYRVFLYSLPGCCFLVAGPVVEALQHKGVRVRLLGATALLAAIAASAQGYFGPWFANLMTPAQVQASANLLKSATYPSWITPAAPFWPERPDGNYVKYANFRPNYDYPLIYQAELIGSSLASTADYNKIMTTVAGHTGGPTYVIFTPQMEVYDDYYGILPRGALANLEAHMSTDPRWTTVASATDYTIFKTTAPTGTS